jgi:hypothetical protein
MRRMKTYAGTSGYVYQYYFVGKRAALAEAAAEGPATEYIFDVSADRKSTYAISVFLPAVVVAGWSAAHGRNLTDAEQYAAAKLRLLQGFDEFENLPTAHRSLVVTTAGLEQVLATLGVD